MPSSEGMFIGELDGWHCDRNDRKRCVQQMDQRSGIGSFYLDTERVYRECITTGIVSRDLQQRRVGNTWHSQIT